MELLLKSPGQMPDVSQSKLDYAVKTVLEMIILLIEALV